ncbi:hypothetical protein [Dehalogenimonas etheniformans]|uniref:Uncharacterized protein n=1 Tax=Dehalogenimonas etheniformans TaxID=1536648 RepID=A0A2P5P6G5_9CHLR|nr:hypothetical protein [Dehalogenimonas etheniformans]PPD57892.1 hypothetical protein JP09_006225 [Dehalogenimonas etheniformans]QNT75456.1 hypothetical protein HX448_01510 [Dehalogenimonas etheniformans]
MLLLVLLIAVLVVLFVVPFRGESGGIGKLLFKGSMIWNVFWSLAVLFGISLLGLVPGLADLFLGAGYAVLFLAIIVLSVALVILTRRSGLKGSIRTSLLVTGISPLAILVVFIIGSAFYEVASYAADIANTIIYGLMAAFVVSIAVTIYLKNKLVRGIGSS